MTAATKIPDQTICVAHKKIALREQDSKAASKIESNFELSSIASRVLAARGITDTKEVESFLKPTLREGLPNPKKLLNLDKACELISSVVNSGQKIAICCDFDVDGLSGGSQVQHFFKSIGVDSRVFVPDRFSEGYGLNNRMVEEIASENRLLMITIDYGTTNVKELELARELGLKTIVIDHHHVSANPPADVFVNPHQEGCGFAGGTLCAAGLAWFLIVALKKALPQASSIDPKSYLDLACLGTICDMVPLRGANRVIAKRGLEALERSARPGIIALKNVIGINGRVKCANVSFGIGPRLNAAGRMVHGDTVIELLTTESMSIAEKIARKLNRLNLERQDTEARVKERAVAMLKEQPSLPSGIVVWDKDFHTGVIGIVAQRLVESFFRPAAVMGLDQGGIYKGSVRGIPGFSVIEALNEVGEYLLKFGGHEGAGGFSVKAENLEKLAEAFNRVCARKLETLETTPHARADTEVLLDQIDIPLISELESFSPFGIGNPGPLLLLRQLEVLDIRLLKNTHLKVTLSDGDRFISGMLWRTAEHPALQVGARVDVACKIGTNNFRGIPEIQLNLQAVEYSNGR